MNEIQRSKNIEYWRSGSQKDLAASMDISRLARRNSHALFFLHLSIEKALKALYVYTNSKFAPLSHNLLNLAAEAKLSMDPAQAKLVAVINDFNLQTRYPNEIDELDKVATNEFTEFHIAEGEKLQKWILEKLK